MPPSVAVIPDKARLPEFLSTEFAAGTFNAALQTFLSEKAAELSCYSVTHLYTSLRPLARALDDSPIAAVAYTDLRAYVDGLYLKYKPGTIKPIVGDIRQFFRWAKKGRLIPKNPAKRLKPPGGRLLRSTAGPKAAPEENVTRLIQHLSSSLNTLVYRDLFGNLCASPVNEWTYDSRQNLRDLLIVVFLHETGARAGELWRLSSRAMDEAVAAPGPVYQVVSTGKSAAVTLWFTIATAELWSVWQTVRPAGNDDYAIVGWRDGHAPTPMRTETISKTIARQCVRAGASPFRAHALRHAKIQRGAAVVGIAVTSRLIGHSSVAMTANYAVAGERELCEAAKKTGLGYRLWG